jgi:peptidyl-prolyl cis-trans isomerase C
MMKSALRLLPLFVASALVAGPALAAAPGVVATVNGKAIPQSRVDLIVSAQKAQGRPDSEDLRKAVRDNLITQEVVMQESVKKGFDKKADVQTQLEFARQEILINAYLAEFARAHPVSPETVKAEYDTFKTSMGDKEYKARHILVEKEEDARAIINGLKKGDKFEELAKQSKDPGSRDKGGDLDWSVPGNYVKAFGEALTKLEKGKFTETPVKTDYGYHVILLEDVRAYNAPSLDELKPQITQNLQRQTVMKHIQELRSKAKID